MSRHTVTFTAETTKNFVPNTRIGSDYSATIQNLSGQSITITVTNQDIQGSSPTFDTPAAGALTITNGAIGAMTAPYDGWLITAAGSTTGTVEIVEAG
jgi:hypothetical protein